MFEIFYKDYIEFLKNYLNKKINNYSLIADKKFFIDHTLKTIIKSLDSIVAPAICWQLYLDKSNNLIKGSNPYQRFYTFINLRKNNLLHLYPELEKIISNYLKEEVIFISETLKILWKNWSRVNKIFNINSKLISIIYPNSSDRHPNGKRTVFLKFINKKCLKVKPYIFSYQPIFNSIFEKFNKDTKNSLKTPKSIKIEHLWVSEFIPLKNKNIDKEVAKIFYKNLGNLFSLTFALNGADFHMENIVAHKSKPVILDSETIFTNYSFFKNINLMNSLLSTGFIEKSTAKQPTSAIFGGNKKLISLVQPIILYKFTDRMRLKFKTFSKMHPHNRIFKNNKILWKPKKFKKNILKGFEESYLWILKNKDYILNLINNRHKSIFSRVVLRKTSFYAILTQHILQPVNFPLKNFELRLEKTLKENSKRFHNNYNKPYFKKIIKYEIENIKKLSIPIFWQNIKERHLYGEGVKYKNFFSKTAFDLLVEKLEKLSRKKLNYYLQKISKYLS